MAKIAVISTHFWSEPRLMGRSFRVRAFCLYLTTNRYVDFCTGIGRMSSRVMAEETGLPLDEVEATKRELGDLVRWYDGWYYWVVDRTSDLNRGNALKRNKDLQQRIRRSIAALPDLLQRAFSERYPELVPEVYEAHFGSAPTNDPASAAAEPAPAVTPQKPTVAPPPPPPPSPKKPVMPAGHISCPHDELVDFYNENRGDFLPECMKPLSAMRMLKLTTRWQDATYRQQWRDIVLCAAKDEELKQWGRAEFEWVMCHPAHWRRILERAAAIKGKG